MVVRLPARLVESFELRQQHARLVQQGTRLARSRGALAGRGGLRGQLEPRRRENRLGPGTFVGALRLAQRAGGHLGPLRAARPVLQVVVIEGREGELDVPQIVGALLPIEGRRGLLVLGRHRLQQPPRAGAGRRVRLVCRG
jgi:hypothetical protein